MLGANVPVIDAEHLQFSITQLILMQKTFPPVTTFIIAKPPTCHFSGCTLLLTSSSLLCWQKRWKEKGSSGNDEAVSVTTNVKGTKSSYVSLVLFLAHSLTFIPATPKRIREKNQSRSFARFLFFLVWTIFICWDYCGMEQNFCLKKRILINTRLLNLRYYMLTAQPIKKLDLKKLDLKKHSKHENKAKMEENSKNKFSGIMRNPFEFAEE